MLRWYELLTVCVSFLYLFLCFLVSDIIFYAHNDDDDFESPVASKREHKPAYFMKSPFVNEFGSSDAPMAKKFATIVKDLHSFIKKIDENLNFDIQFEFDYWMAIGLKKKNKYVCAF